MLVLVLGLLIFLGSHSVRIVAEGWRKGTITRMGDGPWKGAYSLISLIGLMLIIWGYGLARQDPVVVWNPPVWTQHIAVTLNLIAAILFTAYLLPAGRIKARLGHPMLLSIKVWALAHLLANGTLADILLFGSFLVWAVADFAANKRRDRAQGTVRVAGPVRNDILVLVVGVVIWGALVWRLHEWIVGVHPLA
jgi:uncharacterized membrane protein